MRRSRNGSVVPFCACFSAESRRWRYRATSFASPAASLSFSSSRNHISGPCARPLSGKCHSPQSLLQHNDHLSVCHNTSCDAQHQPTGVGDKPRHPLHDLLKHRLQPSALGRMSARCNLADQNQVPRKAQTAVAKRRKMSDGIVGIESARRRPFQIQIGLDLRVKLLAGFMVLVQLDYLGHRKRQACPPAFDLDVGHQKTLPYLVDDARGDAYVQSERLLFLLPGQFGLKIAQADPLARADLNKGNGMLRLPHPSRLVLLSLGPLGDEVEGASARRQPLSFRCLGKQQSCAFNSAVVSTKTLASLERRCSRWGKAGSRKYSVASAEWFEPAL